MIVTKRKVACLLLTVLVLLFELCAQAIEAPDPMRQVGLSLIYQHGEQRVQGAIFKLYLVAVRNAQGGWNAVSPFDHYDLDLSNNDAIDQLAPTLEGYVLRDQLAHVMS